MENFLGLNSSNKLQFQQRFRNVNASFNKTQCNRVYTNIEIKFLVLVPMGETTIGYCLYF